MRCSVCGEEFISKSPQAMYCPSCKKELHKQWVKEHRSRKRHAAMMRHKNDSSYGKNKILLFNYQWRAIVHIPYNYVGVKKTTPESHNSADIWDTIKESMRRGRVEYYSNLENALRATYNHIQLDPNPGRNHVFAKGILSLRNMIVDTDFHGCKQVFDRMLLNHIVSKNDYGADLFSLRNVIVDTKKEFLEVLSKRSDKSFGYVIRDGHRLRNDGGVNGILLDNFQSTHNGIKTSLNNIKNIPKSSRSENLWIALLTDMGNCALYFNKTDNCFCGFEVHIVRIREAKECDIKRKDGSIGHLSVPKRRVIVGSEGFGSLAWHYPNLDLVYEKYPEFKKYRHEIESKLKDALITVQERFSRVKIEKTTMAGSKPSVSKPKADVIAQKGESIVICKENSDCLKMR